VTVAGGSLQVAQQQVPRRWVACGDSQQGVASHCCVCSLADLLERSPSHGELLRQTVCKLVAGGGCMHPWAGAVRMGADDPATSAS